MNVVDIQQLQVIMYVVMTGVLVFALYGYIIYLYRNEKKGVMDYEKFGTLALDDELDSTPLERNSKLENEKKE